MVHFPLSPRQGVIPPGSLKLSCTAGNRAMPLPIGTGFTGRKQGDLEDGVRGLTV